MIDLERSLFQLGQVWAAGPSCEKTPDDLARYEIIIDRVQPAVLVETGLHYGGSLLWFAARVPHVLCVEHNEHDVRDFHRDTWGLGKPPTNGHVIVGDSLAKFGDIEHEAHALACGGPIMVVLDSDHGTEHVWNEMVRYHTLVTPGSYMVVEDGIYHYLEPGPIQEGNWYAGDPLTAIRRWLEPPTGTGWEVDCELEDRFPTTQHPSGWLKRT